MVTEHQRIKESKVNAREKAVYEKEKSMSIVASKHGHRIEHLSGRDRKPGESYDIKFNGIPADLKSFSGAGAMIKQIKHAFKQQGAKIVVVRLENDNEKLKERLMEVRRKFNDRIFFYYQSNPDVFQELFYE